MLKNLIKILALVLFATKANANSLALTLGTSSSYLQSSDRTLGYVNYNESFTPRSVSVGASYFSEEIFLSASTNRFLSSTYMREMQDGAGRRFISKEKSTTDVLMAGYPFGRLIPYGFVSNSNFKKDISLNGRQVKSVDIYSVIYRAGVTRILNKDFTVSISTIIPNEDVDYGVVVSLTYNITIL